MKTLSPKQEMAIRAKRDLEAARPYYCAAFSALLQAKAAEIHELFSAGNAEKIQSISKEIALIATICGQAAHENEDEVMNEILERIKNGEPPEAAETTSSICL